MLPSAKAAAKIIVTCACLASGIAGAADWPHWRGASRSGIVDEPSGYDEGSWKLSEAWQTNVGDGSTSPVMVDGNIYTLGNRNGRDNVVCLDAATGKTLWSADYASPPYGRKATGDQGIYRGTSSTPAYDKQTGYLYTLGIDGDLHCWDTNRKGAKVWHINLYDEYDPPQRPKVGRSGRRDYGYTTSPLVYGDWLVVEVGASAGNTIAFDKRTGRQIWASTNTDPAGHAGGLAPLVVEDVPCLAVQTHFHLLVMRLDRGQEGKTIAEYDWVTEFANSIASPAVHDDCVLITSGYNHHAICKLQITLEGAKRIWKRDVCSKVCTPVIHKGHVYWAWQNVYCLDFETGEVRWKGPSGFGDAGSCVVTRDDRLVVWAGDGSLLLMETATRSPDRPNVLARRDRIFRTDAWPHIVLNGGRLLCKDRDGNLKCFLAGPGGDSD